MLIGVIADDFTGASDIANTLTKGLAPGQGLLTEQYLGVPGGAARPGVEAGVVSLKSRSIAAAEAVSQSLTALHWLRAQGCRQVIFKYCSTFDSTPQGNIGPVGEALAAALGVDGVIVCPAFPEAGRSIYQGYLFVKGRLLHESGMQHHPLNPMTDADLRRWLALQCAAPVGLVPREVVVRGPAAVTAALAEAGAAGARLVITDAIDNADLLTLGRAAADAPLITGGSGIAIGLPANFIGRGLAKGHAVTLAPADGPAAVLAGSCSAATREQVARHARSHPALAVDVVSVMAGTITASGLADFIAANRDRSPLVYSSDEPEAVAGLQSRFGREAVAGALEKLFAETAAETVRRGTRRLVVAGGETSGAAVTALAPEAMAIGPEIDPGVPVLSVKRPMPLALALKSGNFGGPDFFAKALDRMERGA